MSMILIFLKASLAIPLAVLLSALVVRIADKIIDAHMTPSEKTGLTIFLFIIEFFATIIIYKSLTD